MYFQITSFIISIMIVMIKSDISFLYNSNNHNSKTIFDCFYAYIIDDRDPNGKSLIRTNYLTPYCRRSLPNNSINEIEGSIENSYTFKSLRFQEVQSEDLLQWSISIDIIEEYAIYLNTNNRKLDEVIFNNCSSSWFGPRCQYRFPSNISIQSFGDYVNSSFRNRKQYEKKLLIHTCYSYLSDCYRGPEPMCLDWREICDGKIDCIGKDSFGLDEQYCHKLEINECNEDEYRCHNGAQCIPLAFFRDGFTSHDCLDGTDEDEKFRRHLDYFGMFPSIPLNCIDKTIFACEETTCRYPQYFSCGDGNCIRDGLVFNIVGRKNPVCAGTSRDSYYSRAIYMSAKKYPIDCYKLLFCKIPFYYIIKNDLYTEDDCLSNDWLSTNNCTIEYLSFPLQPLFYGYFQPVYSTKLLMSSSHDQIPPSYICNDRRLCSYLPNTASRMYGLDCRLFQPSDSFEGSLDYYLRGDATICQLMGNINNSTWNSSLFYCKQSDKYISQHRLIDGSKDCYHNEDEIYKDSCLLNDTQRFNCTSEDKCLSPVGIGMNLPDCKGKEDKKIPNHELSLFPHLCTGFVDLDREGDDTDETDCHWWPCNNPYTRCDNYFHCANGIDELNCSNINCKINEYKCSIGVKDYLCIPQEYIYEIPLDCSNNNMSDDFCRNIFYSNSSTININNEYISWKDKTCLRSDDICGYQSINDQNILCPIHIYSDVPGCSTFFSDLYDNETLCQLISSTMKAPEFLIISIWNIGYLPSKINSTFLSTEQLINTKPKKPLLMPNLSIELTEYCNRGIIIFEGKLSEKKCLCPPSYFGDQCHLQNQRVSLTLQIRTLSLYEKTISIYVIFIYLIDDQDQIIHSYEEINYIPSIDCETKYNRYFLYPNQPKNVNLTYSIHIDIYEKLLLNYSGSWYLFIPFPFLPVNRIATQIQIPLEKSQQLTNCSFQCGNHGKCFKYINSEKTFCHCDEGYSGRFCNVTYQNSCSPGSIALNSSICLCQLNKFGSKCYLQHSYCQSNSNPCKNHGKCISMDDRITKNGFICLCTENYAGSYCEYNSNEIDITFKIDPIPSVIFAHFIIALNDRDHQLTLIFKKIPFVEDSISLFIKDPFHILFIEFSNNYYLVVLRENYIRGEYISTDIKMNDMCVNITKLLNSTLLSYNNLRRLKYYPLQCIDNKELKCFYDEQHMCICDKSRFSNCFKFNHNISYDCQGHNQCQNNGKCFQDNIQCPTISICMCEECYYGNQCQLTTEGFSISLDVIFGYHIKPSVSFTKQSNAVKITASLTIIIFVLGILNGLLSILTFRRASLLEVGCGIYLLTNSIISIITITIFTIKYGQLIIFHMNLITNRSFMSLCCKLTDVLLKILLSSGDWLNACVAIERAYSTTQGPSFSKRKSKYLTKYIIPILLSLITISYIHDPISRQLFDDKDEERTWCIVKYSINLKIFDRFINIFHFLTPFIINILSAIIIIIQVFRMRSKTKKEPLNRTFLYIQIQRHKRLLISPFILILLASPRLIILLITGCMKSARSPWLFLVGYYISFVPPLLIFTIFVLPSERYKEEFFAAIKKIRSNRQ